MKQCIDCGQYKQDSEYYVRSNTNILDSYCKVCKRKRTKRDYEIRQHDRNITRTPYEMRLIRELAKNRIPATTGKASAYIWSDVVAFGCVPIELKSSANIDGVYKWTFTPTQQQVGIRASVVVLYTTDNNEYYVFNSENDVFYNNVGLKSGITYTPMRGLVGRQPVLTLEIMSLALNNWQLIHDELDNMLNKITYYAEHHDIVDISVL